MTDDEKRAALALLGEARVLEVVEDRTRQATDTLWKALPEAQRTQVRGVAMEMWDRPVVIADNVRIEACGI